MATSRGHHRWAQRARERGRARAAAQPASEAARGSAPHRAGAGVERKGGTGAGAALAAWRMGARRRPARSRRDAGGAGGFPGAGAQCPSATGGCWSRRSPSSAARPIRWRPTWQAAPRTGLEVQLCGDAHLSNFGGFAAPDRRLVFGINDFDETLPGPFEWDVKRLVASFAVAGRDRGFDAKQRRSINRTVTRSYREAMNGLAGMSNLDVWYSRIEVDEIAAAGGSARHPEAAQAVRAQRGQGAGQGQHEGTRKAHRDGRRRAQDRQRPAADRPDRGAGDRRRPGRPRRFRPGSHPYLPAFPERRSPAAARAVSLRSRGAEGRRRGQRRDARVDLAHARARRERSALPAAQGGAGVGPRAVPGQELVRQARPAGRRGSAAARRPPATSCSAGSASRRWTA